MLPWSCWRKSLRKESIERLENENIIRPLIKSGDENGQGKTDEESGKNAVHGLR